MAVAATGGVLLAGCGQARQDAQEPSGTFTVQIVRASFPTNQTLAQRSRLRLVIRNTGTTTVPDLAVSVDSLSQPSKQPALANSQRPIWIVDVGPGRASTHPIEGPAADGPGGAVTAYTSTWALGAVKPGHTKTFVWQVTAVKPGVHTITYTVAAGLNGKARARLSDGTAPRGSFTVNVAQTPAQTHVDPATGRVVPGPPPLASG